MKYREENMMKMTQGDQSQDQISWLIHWINGEKTPVERKHRLVINIGETLIPAWNIYSVSQVATL